jgi:hypothetical protein
MKPIARTVVDFMLDPQLFGRAFPDKASWWPWAVFLKAWACLPMDQRELDFFRQCTGRSVPPTTPYADAAVVGGRRGGKSATLALIGAYLAIYKDYSSILRPGERGVILLISQSQKQATQILSYIVGMFAESPLLRSMIERQTADSLDLTNRVTIQVGTTSFRSIRGFSFIAVLLDELSFWRDELSANPDREIVGAARPGLLRSKGPMIGMSSPYSKRGQLFHWYSEWFGKDDQPLCWQAATQTMFPSVDMDDINKMIAADPELNISEFLAEWRGDIEGFCSVEVARACVSPGIHERPPDGHRYTAFIDVASGSGADSMTLGISHPETEKVILDVAHEIKPPFNPDVAAADMAHTLRRYGINKVTGDKVAKGWVAASFKRHGIRYIEAEHTKSELYLHLLPLLTSNRVALLDQAKLFQQLIALERHTGKSGRDAVDHPKRGAHDDLINSVAGALVLAAQKMGKRRSAHAHTGGAPFYPSDGQPRNIGMYQQEARYPAQANLGHAHMKRGGAYGPRRQSWDDSQWRRLGLAGSG